VALVVAALALVYFVLFPTSSPKRFAIGSVTPAPSSTSTASGGGWTVAAGSQAGYRVREKLAVLPAKSDAVGRTSQITGSASSTGSGRRITFTNAAFRIDVSSLRSDRAIRDQRIHEIGLESGRFPTATFVLSKPLTVAAGRVAHVKATGVLTLHGVAKTVRIPLQVRLAGSAAEAVGSLTFPWSEFGMTAPSVAGFVRVEDKATLEFDLHLTR
jgi:polyisoprenoid-binding protein YceI